MPYQDVSVIISYQEFCEFSYNKNKSLLEQILDEKLTHDTLAVAPAKITKIIEKPYPGNETFSCGFYGILARNLSPVHFLTNHEFDAEKTALYTYKHSDLSYKHDIEFYSNPENLTDIGKLRVFVELQRIELEYLNHFHSSQYLSPEQYIIFYLYNSPKGYKILNTLFWDFDKNEARPHMLPMLRELLDVFKPNSDILQDPLYDYLKQHLTPKHFLNDRKFAEQRKLFYQIDTDTNPNCDDTKYEDPSYLSPLGKLRVFIELKRLEERFHHEFSTVRNRITHETDEFLSIQQFLAIYLYSTNLGYRKINTYLRTQDTKCRITQHNTETHNTFGSYTIPEVVEFIDSGLDRLSSTPKYKLNGDERQLIRYSDLPESVLKDIVVSAINMNTYLDKAFLSTSFNPDGAEGFAFSHNFKLIIKTYGSNIKGAKINGISAMSDEDEFLLSPGVKLQCHPDNPIVYDDTKKVCVVYVCAINISTVVATAVMVNRARSILMGPVHKLREQQGQPSLIMNSSPQLTYRESITPAQDRDITTDTVSNPKLAASPTSKVQVLDASSGSHSPAIISSTIFPVLQQYSRTNLTASPAYTAAPQPHRRHSTALVYSSADETSDTNLPLVPKRPSATANNNMKTREYRSNSEPAISTTQTSTDRPISSTSWTSTSPSHVSRLQS